MVRRDGVFSAPPPPYLVPIQNSNTPQALDSGGSYNPVDDAASSSSNKNNNNNADNLSPSIIITILVLATAIIVSASLYLLLRFINRHCRRSSSTADDVFDSVHHHHLHRRHNNNSSNNQNQRHQNNSSRVMPEESSSFLDSLPLFTFASISSNGRNTTNSGGDCAVCLSKFEPHDQLRLLPICCHAFHAECIDTWLVANQTCPLCRSSIFVSESEVLSKLLRTTSSASSGQGSGSFRVEIGNVSHRQLPTTDSSGEQQRTTHRSYSIGSFDYIVEDLLSEVTVAQSGRRDGNGGDKNETAAGGGGGIRTGEIPGQNLAAEVGGGGGIGRSWLRDYVDRLGWNGSFSLSSSLRSSGRFFTGSSRRTTTEGIRETDLEASRLGDEIGEMFRWLSGV